ncbi:MAG: hypothetical protein AB1473_15095 [Thermodesulfobacteriota bacterium]
MLNRTVGSTITSFLRRSALKAYTLIRNTTKNSAETTGGLIRSGAQVVRGLRIGNRRVIELERRILAVWDFREVPFTVGELLYHQEVSLILREVHQVEKIDLALLLDSAHPGRFDQGLTPGNAHYYFSKLLPAAFANPHLGSLLVFDSAQALDAYIADNRNRYHVFPPYVDEHGRKIKGYEHYFNYVQEFHRDRGYIPHLSCRTAMVAWARCFLAEHVRPRFPVSLQLRNNMLFPDRNSKLDEWLEFVSFCESRFPVTFILIGDQEEVDSRFRNRPNVVIPKDHGTTLEQDLALIQASMLHMGSVSGPTMFAIFRDAPYLIYRFRVQHEEMEWGSAAPWATPLQKLGWESETHERIEADFSAIWSQLRTDAWAEDFDRLAREAAGILRRESSVYGLVQGKERSEK